MQETPDSTQHRVPAWIEHRTGILGFTRAALYEHIPGGARWRYVWGSTLTFAFVVQMITGFFLWTVYAPSSLTAWESVHHIQYEMSGGWLLRGIHHYTAQLMVILIAIHMMQVIVDGAYRGPREFNFWIGLILFQLVLALGLTGYLLPWDQKGYWATKVATNISGLTPFFGDQLKHLIVGGSEYGHHTLTRFFALHAGLLPFLMITFIAIHIAVFRRHSLHDKRPHKRPDSYFWPDQVLKDGVACLGVLLVVLFLVFQHSIFGGSEAVKGASLMAPADPSVEYGAARPDWYFLFLYEFLKYFEGSSEVVGAIYIPGAAMFVIALMPLVGRWKLGHAFNVVFFFALLVGAGALTAKALYTDATDPKYELEVTEAETDAHRIHELVQERDIPPIGAASLLYADPKTQGAKLFRRYCSTCHTYDGHNGRGGPPEESPSASDLKGFASREWLKGFFDPEKIIAFDKEKILVPRYFGGTKFTNGKMARYVQGKMKSRYNPDNADDREKLDKVIIALSSEARLKSQRNVDSGQKDIIEEGLELMADEDGLDCLGCHDGEGSAPDLLGYGSFKWLTGIINNAAHERFYGKKNDRMPSFGPSQILRQQDVALIAHWLRGEWFVPGEGPWQPEDTSETEEDTSPASSLPDPDAGEGEEKVGTVTPQDPPGADSAPPADQIDFVQHVKPILERHCLECHGGGKKRPKGKYSLVTREKAFGVGDSEEAGIVAKDRSGSLLFALISSDDEDERMPPDGKAPPLSPAQIETIGRWIDVGAPWPDGVELDVAEESK